MIDGELLAVIAERAGQDPAALRWLAEPLGALARHSAAELAAAEPAERTRRIARVLAAVASPVPASARRAHPDWIELALAEPEASAVLTSASHAPVAVWLARRALGWFPHGQLSPQEREGLESWLRRRGATALAVVVENRRATVAAAMAQLAAGGEVAVAELALAVRRLERGEGEPPGRREAIAACHGVELRRPESLWLIGVAVSKAALRADRVRWRGLVVYFPRAVGLAIAEAIE
ncbi:MAG: hypothetical protein IPI49_11395 [Myxococcales bacterium]|nr:hypothetical protein [Myxococcales bacterium]